MYWYTCIVVWRMDAIAAITKSWAKMSRLEKRDGFNVGRMECARWHGGIGTMINGL